MNDDLKNLVQELNEAMEPLSVDKLEELNEAWQQELERIGMTEKVRNFCRIVTETVINRKKQNGFE